MKKEDEELRLPVACSLPPLELRLRVTAIRQGIARRITAVEDLEDGIALRLAPLDEALPEAMAFVEFERQCCEFATFELQRDEAGDALRIEIRGPEGTKRFFEELLSDLVPRLAQRRTR
ncbi:MAG TPA: hypothetical protein VEK15_19180 [Vicinamibacteria bacterium]|nr:hypothetical protein [Vicinamibacteria bacterium]